MLNCREISKLLHDYIEQSIAPDVSKQLDAHLADCPGCVASIKTYKRTVDLSRDLRCDDISPDLKQKLRSFIKEKQRKPNS